MDNDNVFLVIDGNDFIPMTYDQHIMEVDYFFV